MNHSKHFAPSPKTAALIAATGLGLIAFPAEAYVGPGAGITLLGALWAVIAALAFALGGLLIWPARVLRRRFRQKKSAAHPELNRQVQEP
jgi:hypothetical protein